MPDSSARDLWCAYFPKNKKHTIRSVSFLITDRNEVVVKVMFLLVSVILSTGGLRQGDPCRETPGREPPIRETPLAGRAPRGKALLPAGRALPPSRENPLQQGEPPPGRETPLAGRPPWQGAPPGIRPTSGRYASYWNAFLLDYYSHSINP